jgi:hypothetical protein
MKNYKKPEIELILLSTVDMMIASDALSEDGIFEDGADASGIWV